MRPAGKKAFEMSVGFIVILIMTVVIFTSSIIVINKFFGTTQDIEQSLSTDAQQQIERLLTGGQRVAVVPQLVETTKGKAVTAGIGFVNTEPATNFYVYVMFAKAFDPDGKPLLVDGSSPDPETMNKWVLYGEGPYKLEKSQSQTAKLIVSPQNQIASGVGTAPGTYIFDVCVTRDTTNQAGPVHGSGQATACATQQPDQIPGLYTGQKYKFQVVVS